LKEPVNLMMCEETKRLVAKSENAAKLDGKEMRA
jgi:hypothetical protein